MRYPNNNNSNNNKGGGRRVFGQTMRKKSSSSSSSSRYQRQFGGNGGSGGGGSGRYRRDDNNNNNSNNESNNDSAAAKAAEAAARRRLRQEQGEKIDLKFGYSRLEDESTGTDKSKNHNDINHADDGGPIDVDKLQRRGWLFHMMATTKMDPTSGVEQAGLDLYFVDNDGGTFKTTIFHRPYFYLLTKSSSTSTTVNENNNINNNGTDDDVDEDSNHVYFGNQLVQRLGSYGLVDAQWVDMVDLDKPNHLSPNHLTRKVWKLQFDNVSQLMETRNQLMEWIRQKRPNQNQNQHYQQQFDSMSTILNNSGCTTTRNRNGDNAEDWTDQLIGLREYDVPYVVRVCMDLKIRAGSWYTVTIPDTSDDEAGVGLSITNNPILSDVDIETKANPRVLAFDIECSKAPLKFPNADVDEIYMISFMKKGPIKNHVDGHDPTAPRGILICSRTIVSQDVSDFEYTPKPTYPGPFSIFNETDEKALIRRFITEFQTFQPQIVVTYNGDSFDWPFLWQRAQFHNIDLWKELGMTITSDGEVRGRCCVHLDAFGWVQRDSYLPQGAQGLKAVTKYKLGYDPVEVDPEDMLPMAQEQPVHMATYSVSDAVATFYLYEKYVHLFIFSLCTLIPMGPEDVLRKGSGTLCEALLMVQANDLNIICPNKQIDPLAKFHKGHLLESETYIGGKVECLETGVYRSDIEYDFDLKPTAFQQLIDNIDRDLCFAIEVEAGMDRSEIANYEEVRSTIVEQLEFLRDRPKRTEKPFIYHLDVGAMYPNIILTNRLQPSAIVDDATCAACDFNQAKNGCKRRMDWIWRGDYNPAGKLEYERTKDQLSREIVKDGQRFTELTDKEQASMVSTRLKEYSRNAFRKTKITEEVTRNDIVCMRENDFYVETVRRFRDRRYEYKKMTKSWKKKIGSAKDPSSKKEAEDKALVYDSLQVAHKCILNSFYGYVMRKGARWRSMEMAGIVTKTGADIITQARILVEQIGRPLELDTDGIWCILPKSFPDIYTFKTRDGSKLKLEYPCVMLNADVHDFFTNHQYQTLKDPKRGQYESRSECSIFFEVDGPYRCMVLPASTEEGKLLKKRYAVFNFDGSLAELKGFELKRRGELELIKTFQSQVFERFLDGESLAECYDSVADVANHWIDVIDTRGDALDDEELVDLISENRNMSRQLDEYGDQKGTSQTTARRLGEFLGAEIIKDKGLSCKFIIAEQPYGAPVTERAIPTAIWKAEPAVTKHFLRRWLRAPGLDGDGLDIRNILDWDYYLDRLGKTIQKIITIPAALQKVPNPVPRVAHPGWLHSKVQQLNDRFQQKSITSMFGPKKEESSKDVTTATVFDIEDIGGGGTSNIQSKRPTVHKVKRLSNKSSLKAKEKSNEEDEEPLAASASASATDEPNERISLDKDNFNDWLKQKKSIWRKSRQAKRRLDFRNGGGNDRSSSVGTSRRRLGGSSSSTTMMTTTTTATKTARTLEGFVREAAKNLTEREWQILEIREMTSYDTGLTRARKTSSGQFVVWVMVGNDSLQKVEISVPRTVYVGTSQPIKQNVKSADILDFRKVDKLLPHSQGANFLYEVTLPEYVYRNKDWISNFYSEHDDGREKLIRGIYETKMPLMMRALTELGCVSKVSQSSNTADGRINNKSMALSDLERVDKPTEGPYLNTSVVYKRCHLYVRMKQGSKTGIIAVFGIKQGSGTKQGTDDTSPVVDITAPGKANPGTFDVSASCHIWIITPGARSTQQNINLNQCGQIFSQLLATIQEAADFESEYSSVSASSSCVISSLKFVRNDDMALAAANDVVAGHVKSNNGPTLLLVNSCRPVLHLRRKMTIMNSVPVVPLPFPPGPDHSPNMSTLPALNWEQPAVQLCLEAYLYMSVVSFPKRVSYARYGNLPVANLGDEENFTMYDISLARILKKNRALSWASPEIGQPDLGASYLPSLHGQSCASLQLTSTSTINEDVWGDDDELISPVVRRPGCYRTVCVDIDLHDLAIAALTETTGLSSNLLGAIMHNEKMPASPTSVLQMDGGGTSGFQSLQSAEPLGDEMSTSTALPMLRAMIAAWLRDAFSLNSEVADALLHNVYRLVSNPAILLHDPALHRIVHTLMKTTFVRLLSELQRLGCSIVYATFHKITVATNKASLADAEEYINFVISTIRKRSEESGDGECSLSRVALRPRQFHSHFIFLDEYNFGTMHLERVGLDDIGDEFHIEVDATSNSAVVPSVVTAWSLMNYMGSEIAQEYFRIIVGRFSKEVLKKQIQLTPDNDDNNDGENGTVHSIYSKELRDQLIRYKKKMVSKHFASYLTRAVGEIESEEYTTTSEDDDRLGLTTKRNGSINPVLEFIKSVIVVLSLDTDVDSEVHGLKRSLLAQVGVAEYSSLATWENPCPTFILPDVFCSECHESRDINLCYIAPPADDEEGENNTKQIHWFCEDCGTEYDVVDIERRLIKYTHKKILRYQLQDTRCSKTNRVATGSLARISECAAENKLDISQNESRSELNVLQNLATHHRLDELNDTIKGMLSAYR